jgi:Tfp pilus assembly protein PilO
MTEQKKFYLLLTGLLLAVFLWFYFYYIPTLDLINQNKARLLTYGTKISSASDASENIENINKTLEDLKSELSYLEKKIVDKSKLENFAKLMESEAKKYKLSVINVSPVVNYYFKIGDINPSGTYIARLPFEMNLTANFMSFSKFLSNLDKLPFYIHPEGFSIEVSKEFPGDLDIRLLSSVYVKTGK